MNHIYFLALILLVSIEVCLAATKDKKHGHNGVLAAYTGKHLPMKISGSQSKKLDKGDAVLYNERDGKSGKGVCIQDIEAEPKTCMDKIRNLKAYVMRIVYVVCLEDCYFILYNW